MNELAVRDRNILGRRRRGIWSYPLGFRLPKRPKGAVGNLNAFISTMVQRKRRRRRRAYGRRRFFRRRMPRRRYLRPETKSFVKTISDNVENTWTADSLCNIAQDLGQHQRVGADIQPKNLVIRYRMNLAAIEDGPESVRLVVLMERGNFEGTSMSPGDIFQANDDTTSATAIPTTEQPKIQENIKNTMILWDRKFLFHPSGEETYGGTKRISLRKIMRFNDSATTNIKYGRLLVLYTSESTNAVTLNLTSKLTYWDS